MKQTKHKIKNFQYYLIEFEGSHPKTWTHKDYARVNQARAGGKLLIRKVKLETEWNEDGLIQKFHPDKYESFLQNQN